MNRSNIKNPINQILERAVQLSRDSSAPVRTSGANGFGGTSTGFLPDSGAANGGGIEDGGAFTIPALDEDGNVYTQNVLYWGLDNWGENLWG